MSSVLESKNTKSMLEVKGILIINTEVRTIEKSLINYLNNRYLSAA
jgi:hypothetical protein